MRYARRTLVDLWREGLLEPQLVNNAGGWLHVETDERAYCGSVSKAVATFVHWPLRWLREAAGPDL